jgi:hypothetical protein
MLPIARMLMIAGILLFLFGGLLYLSGRAGLPLGRLPGDIRIQGANYACFIPLATSILLSIVLTLVINIAARFLNR